MEFQFDLFGGWWYSAVFGLVNLIFIFSSSKSKIKRLMRFPKFKSKMERIISYISVIFFSRGLIILTILIPINFHLLSFIIGTSLFFLCLSFYAMAMNNFLSSAENEPVTKGIYKLLHHPMQILTVIMWIGVGIATLSWLIIAACFIQFIISYPFLVAQERENLDVYGEKYKEYLDRVKRYCIM